MEIKCCTDTDSFIVYVKSGEVYVGLVGDVEESFDTWNYDVVLRNGLIHETMKLRDNLIEENNKRICGVETKDAQLFHSGWLFW